MLNILKRLPNFRTNKIGKKKHKNKKVLFLILKSFSTNIKIFIYWKIQNRAPILSWPQNPIFRPCKDDSYVKICELQHLINIIWVQQGFPFTPWLHTFIGQKNPIIPMSPQFMPLHLAKIGQNRWRTQLGIEILLSQAKEELAAYHRYCTLQALPLHTPYTQDYYTDNYPSAVAQG